MNEHIDVKWERREVGWEGWHEDAQGRFEFWVTSYDGGRWVWHVVGPKRHLQGDTFSSARALADVEAVLRDNLLP